MLEDMDNILTELDKKVCHFIKQPSKITTFSYNSLLPDINSKIIVYTIAPVVLLIIFITTKPSFIMSDIIVEGVIVDSKLNISKMVFITIIVAGIIDIYIYNRYV
jgi:hypothetical protein